MTIQDLYAIDNFEGLFTDARFQALLIYLRKKRPHVEKGDPHNVILDGGRSEGWLSCLEEADKAAHMPSPAINSKPPTPYSTSRPGMKSETNAR